MLLSEMGSFKFCYTCIHTYIDILKHTYRDKTDIYMRACMYACVHTYTQTNAHIRTCIHTGTGIPYPLGKFVQRTIGWYQEGEGGSIMGTPRQEILQSLGVVFPPMLQGVISGATSLMQDRPHTRPRIRKCKTDITENTEADFFASHTATQKKVLFFI